MFAKQFAAKPEVSGSSTQGKLLEAMLADPAAFDATHVRIPAGISKTSKEGKALHADLASEGKIGVEPDHWEWLKSVRGDLIGKTLLPGDTLDDVQRMAMAARRHPLVAYLAGVPHMCETSIFWTDAETGVSCKCRPDLHVPPGLTDAFPDGLIVDGKSCQDASPEGFGKNAWNAKMHIQAAFYTDGFMAAYRRERPPVFIWLAQEADVPYATAVYVCTDDLLEYGRTEYAASLRVLAECQRTGHWPGYSTGVMDLHVPGWAQKVLTNEGEIEVGYV